MEIRRIRIYGSRAITCDDNLKVTQRQGLEGHDQKWILDFVKRSPEGEVRTKARRPFP